MEEERNFNPIFEEERKVNPIFEKLQKKFQVMKLKEQTKKIHEENLALSERFEIQIKNFENTLFNSTLYNVQEAVKEIPLSITYAMQNDLEEYIYLEYFRSKYPYSSVIVDTNSGNTRKIKITLLDEDREKFLYARGFKVEQRQIPETYFVPLK